ncbi:membrane protein [Vibrio phage vB_VpaS_1601]|uniref:membrane protein n=1 Tax=Vibrio phage SHOU24 TaxID=1414739 RepID=UPI0003ED2070|nr:membrane protein [Vibrio phage SHOU24]AHI61252.1 membrane protein [Vibrio phage SHOU24]WHM52724.1 membrane protein [Vibrio phage vB_VpaP_1601]
MSYGLKINFDGYPDIDISSGWYPPVYLGYVDFVTRSDKTPTSVTMANVPSGAKLYAYADTQTSKTNGGSGSNLDMYSVRCWVEGNTVNVAMATWRYISSSSPNLGKTIRFYIFATLPPSSISGYGLAVMNDPAGINAAINQDSSVAALVFKFTDRSIGAGKSKTYNTGLSTSSPAPVVFVSDSGYNCLSTYVFSSGGTWHISLYRTGGYWNTDWTSNNWLNETTPRSGVVRLAAFAKNPDPVSGYGMALYNRRGECIMHTSRPPLITRRTLTNPTPTVPGNPPSANKMGEAAGDKLSAQDMSNHPMLIGRDLGISVIENEALPTSVWLQQDGTWTSGTLSRVNTAPSVTITRFGWFGTTGDDLGQPFIYGTDYFDDY